MYHEQSVARNGSQANWIPLRKIALGPGTKPFSFAGHHVQPLYAALLVARVQDIQGKSYTLKICTHILPATPIPFPFGLVDQRSLGFDICLLNGNASYLKITDPKFNTTIPLIVSSHVWLRFSPINNLPLDDPAWNEAIQRSLDSPTQHADTTQLVYMNAQSRYSLKESTSLHLGNKMDVTLV